jgi:hypothetical protein
MRKPMKTPIAALVALACLLGLAGLSRSREVPPVTVPEEDRSRVIRFSHQFHLNEVGAKCTDCHTEAARSDRASDRLLPRKAACGQCHDVEDRSECGKCHHDPARAADFRNPERIVEFPHRLHLEKAGLSCTDCHLGLDRVDYASRANWPAMEDCLRCHDNLKAPMDCDNCHSRIESLRPRSHGPAFLREHRAAARSATMPCAKCHDEGFCQECHLGARLLERKAPTDRTAPGEPQTRGRVPQTLRRQHSLNYRATHPMDAVGKERQCAVCHDTRSFCADCHRARGFDDRSVKPRWHGDGGEPWILGRVGNGGRHAEWARRDIERCTACHDAEGGDPSCLQCHVDFDGRQRTDPRTHDRYTGREDDRGFHRDPGAVCYACHVNTRRPGTGFCGYCHGTK